MYFQRYLWWFLAKFHSFHLLLYLKCNSSPKFSWIEPMGSYSTFLVKINLHCTHKAYLYAHTTFRLLFMRWIHMYLLRILGLLVFSLASWEKPCISSLHYCTQSDTYRGFQKALSSNSTASVRAHFCHSQHSRNPQIRTSWAETTLVRMKLNWRTCFHLKGQLLHHLCCHSRRFYNI